MRAAGVGAVTPYRKLHEATMDRRCARTHGEMANAVDAADRLLRLPTWLGPIEHVEEFIARIRAAMRKP